MPHRPALVLSIVFMMLISGPVLAQGPATLPRDAVIPEIIVEDTPFEDVMAFLRERVPGFQVQILRDTGVRGGQPRVTFRGREVTLGQVMDFLHSAYNVEWQEIQGPQNWIFIARVNNPRRVNQLFGAQVPSVRAFSLASVPVSKEKGMADVLSVVQAALEAGGVTAGLSVHESSRVLLASGDPTALAIVEQVISTLKPAQDDVRRQYESRLQEAEQALKLRQIEFETRLRAMEVERARMEQALEGQQQELRARVQQLQAQLEAARARGANQP